MHRIEHCGGHRIWKSNGVCNHRKRRGSVGNVKGKPCYKWYGSPKATCKCAFGHFSSLGDIRDPYLEITACYNPTHEPLYTKYRTTKNLLAPPLYVVSFLLRTKNMFSPAFSQLLFKVTWKIPLNDGFSFHLVHDKSKKFS